eukprot:6521284-Pyramimonas_sp.AAC.1
MPTSRPPATARPFQLPPPARFLHLLCAPLSWLTRALESAPLPAYKNDMLSHSAGPLACASCLFAVLAFLVRIGRWDFEELQVRRRRRPRLSRKSAQREGVRGRVWMSYTSGPRNKIEVGPGRAP